MSRVDEKLKNFANDVMADVGEERRLLIEDLDNELRAQYEKKENEDLKGAYDLIQDALISIAQKKNESLSRIILRNRTKLFEKRNQIIEGIYDKAISKLKAFKETDAYIDFLLKQIKEAQEALGEGHIIVKLDFSDRTMVETLQTATGLEVTVDSKKIQLLGGSIVMNMDAHRIVDQTFSRKLESIRDEFVQHCQIEIE